MPFQYLLQAPFKSKLETLTSHDLLSNADLGVELRIHEHTERGDNDTIKMPNGKIVTIDGKKCSD